MQEIKKLLIVEDNLPDSILLQEYLTKLALPPQNILLAERIADVIKISPQQSPDLIFLDLNLPDSNGLETFLSVQNHFLNAIIIVLSGLEDTYVALQAMQAGADDYLVKGELDEKLLLKTVSYSIERKRHQLKIKESEETYKSLLENASEALIVLDVLAGKFISVSKTACDLFKVSEEELLSLTTVDLMPPLQPDGTSSAEVVLEMFSRLLSGEKPFFEWIFWDKNKKEIPCEVRLVKMPSEDRLLVRGSIIDISERKKADQALLSSEKKYRRLIEQATDGILLVNKEGCILLANESCARLTGHSIDDLTTMKFYDFAVPEDIEKEPYYFEEMLLGNNVIIERKMRNKKGELLDIEVNARMMDDGTILTFIRDITDKKKAAEEILLSNARFHMISKATSDIVWDWDLENDKGWYNDNYYRKLEIEKNDHPLDMSQWFNRIHPEDVDRVQKNIDQILKGADDTWRDEYRFLRNDGVYLNFLDRGFIIRNNNGTAIRMIGSMVDMTAIYSAQNEVIESENRLRTILETNPECIKLLDKGWRVIEINTGGLQMVEADDPTEVLNQCLLPMMIENYRQRATRLLNDAFEGKQGRLELEMITLKQHKRWAEITMVPFRNSKGDIIYALGVTRDITKRKEAEKELAASYKAIRELTGHLQNIREEERTNIAREIHDELGQQLTVLKMDASWLKKKVGDTSTVVGNKIEELISMLDDTVKSVRRISSELRPSLLDDLGLIAAIEWQLGEFEKRSGIATHCIHKEDELEIPDKAKTTLFRIFQESLTNVARHSQANKVTVSIAEVDDNIVLSIEDNGKGFDKKKIAEKRTLGILGMKERTSMIAGAYDITSTPGKGTIVAVKIPCSKN